MRRDLNRSASEDRRGSARSSHQSPGSPRMFGLVLALALGCAPTTTAPRLVVLYATCTLNRSFLEPYVPTVAYTPALRAFGADALVFSRHQTESGQSGVAFASLLSGSQADRHGVYRHPTVLQDDVPLITEAFAGAGYDVHSWLDHPMANARLGYARGTPPDNVHERSLTGDDVAFQAILGRLESDPEYKAFVVTNFTVTHGPYSVAPLDEFCERHPGECGVYERDPRAFRNLAALYRERHLAWSFDFDRTVTEENLPPTDLSRLADAVSLLYRANVAELDALFGGMVHEIDAAGLRDQSLVTFTADHGEILHRRNASFHWTHGYQLAPEVLTVPLVVRGPGAGVRAGRYDGVTRSIDVFPTLAGLAGIPAPGCSSCGVDLSHAVRGHEPPPSLVAFSHTALMNELVWASHRRYRTLGELFPDMAPSAMWVGARVGDEIFKRQRRAGRAWETVMFDLGADPGETRDRFDRTMPAHREMAERLVSYQAALVAAYDGDAAELGRAEVRERLRSLGYIR